MSKKQKLKLSGLLFGLVLGAGFGNANGQPAAPTETKGVTQKLLATHDLGPEIEGMAGRQLRMRKVTIEPGGVFGVHNHKDRPGILYILEGTIIETRNGVAKEYGPGEVFSEGKDTTHWLENKGSVPVVFVPVDIFKVP